MTVISLIEFFYFLENLGAKKFTSINKNLNEKFHLVKFTIKCYDPLKSALHISENEIFCEHEITI